ncbi:hypothetical protein Tco_1334700 [Tanacetum coccineum]
MPKYCHCPLKSPFNHEPLITIVVSVSVVDRSIGTDNPRPDSGFMLTRTMATIGQGMSSMEIEQIIAQRVTNAIEAIAIYETKTRVAHDSIDQVARQGAKVVKDVKNKRKWESGYDRKSIIMECLVNISKSRAFWSLNEDILKITILKTNTPYPSRKIRRIRACTHQRPQRNEAQYAIEEVMANKGKKSSMEIFAPNAKADYYSEITNITVNGKNAYEQKGKFLDDLHNNAFSGTNRKDTFEHIEYYLKIIDPINLPNVDHDKLRVVVFPTSLAGGARRWLDKIKESITCGDEIELSDDESSDLEEYRSDKEETTKNFKIETGVFEYEAPLCLAFNEFNYLLKIYEWNKDIPWVDEKPWTEAGVWTKLKPIKHTCKPFNYKTGCSEWPTCSWKEDGYCNGGNFPGAYHIGNSLHYQDLEWYEALEDSELKDEALRNKAIMEGLISDNESCNDCSKRWKSHEI